MSRIFRASSQGMTLIELLMTLVLIAALLGSLWMTFDVIFRTFYSQDKRSEIKGEAGRQFFLMSQEMRQATSVTTAQTAAVYFTFDTDGNGTDETIQYSWSGTAGTPLQRTQGSVVVPVVNSVQTASFTYYDSSHNLLSFPVTLADVKLVALDLTVSSQDETFQLRSQVRLRNL